jgi:predicted regulator of Ras-like GTPase activity (Roadblock/LC7/MglB family)
VVLRRRVGTAAADVKEAAMLRSLFGDLTPPKTPGFEDTEKQKGRDAFTATTILESSATSMNSRGQMVDQLVKDIFISGSAVQAMREHFAHAPEVDAAPRRITLFDPHHVWAPGIIKALSEASSQPVEQLRLRDRATLQTLAMIERTYVVRRQDETLKIYHPDVRSREHETASIPLVLMERSDLSVLILGQLPTQSLDALLDMLVVATHGPGWRCPTVLFMLPPSSARVVDRIGAQDWPPALRVQMLSESFGNTSAVWNALLGVWNRAKAVPRWERKGGPQHELDFPIKVADFDGPAAPDPAPVAIRPEPATSSGALTPIDPLQASRALLALLQLDGLYGCALADAGTGKVIAEQVRDAQEVDLDQAAAAGARLLDAHRNAAQEMGLPDVDEVTASAGSSMQVLRTIAQRPGLFMLAVMDRGRTNLGMVRLRMAEAQKTLF